MAIRRNEGAKMKKNILVLGAGAWGTAIANLLAENIKEDVLIWGYEKKVVDEINNLSTNNIFLPKIKLNRNLIATNSYIGKKANIIFIVVPSQYVSNIIKEYLSRGTHVFPPAPSLRLISDMITYTYKELPKWNPVNICSYHLQEVGAKPVQELAFALSTAVAYLDRVKEADVLSSEEFENVVGRISFFVNSGIKFITEMCKMRAFVDLWDEITQERYGVKNPKNRRFRYGVQVNSLGLTEQQPENNVYRILIEMMAVVLSKDARARAVQLPAWNEALGLPRPWDQQWSLRLQQILAYETDLLEFEDLFNGS